MLPDQGEPKGVLLRVLVVDASLDWYTALGDEDLTDHLGDELEPNRCLQGVRSRVSELGLELDLSIQAVRWEPNCPVGEESKIIVLPPDLPLLSLREVINRFGSISNNPVGLLKLKVKTSKP